MSFFNLTHTGVQDPFKTASYAKKEIRENDTETTQQEDQLMKGASSQDGNPPHSTTQTASHVHTMYLSSETGETGRSWHRGSHSQYTQLLRKHQRQPQGPMDLYQHPLTTSNDYGWWMKNGSPHKEPWAQCERHVYVNSEMTRFVDDMSQTNKEFTLY